MPRPSLKETGKSTRRQALISAAEEIFTECGYEGTTVDALVKKAGMAKGSFYLHFGSKDEIFQALVREMGDRLVGEVKALAASDAPTCLKLKNIAGVILGFHLKSRLAMYHMMLSRGPGRQTVVEHFIGKRRLILKILGRIFVEGAERGDVAQEDPERLSTMFLGCIQGVVIKALTTRAQMNPDAEAEWFVDRLFSGLRPGRADSEH